MAYLKSVFGGDTWFMHGVVILLGMLRLAHIDFRRLRFQVPIRFEPLAACRIHLFSASDLELLPASLGLSPPSSAGASASRSSMAAWQGMTGTIVAAVPFNDGWLAEWQSGSRRWLLLHSRRGKPISTGIPLPVDGDLFDSRISDGLHFLKWENGKPAELMIVPASVEWTRALD